METCHLTQFIPEQAFRSPLAVYLLTLKQFGFIKTRSTTTAATQIIESIIDKLAMTILWMEKLKALGTTGKDAQRFDR